MITQVRSKQKHSGMTEPAQAVMERALCDIPLANTQVASLQVCRHQHMLIM